MKIKEYLNQCVTCDLFYHKDKFQEINNLEYLHPEDRDFARNNLTNTIYKCIGIDGEYLILRSTQFTLRVNPKLVINVFPSPSFDWGDTVEILGKPEIQGTICDFQWHYKKELFYYFIEINGKQKSRRYFENELQLLHHS